ncbi:MAG: hypothetical protein KDJ86_09015 [Bauldia sp.]|uniref:hypothetical protein n=1 Tax=Bauldia sp. TaxID=2575872 RepID=UPI001D5FDEC1|nr:hypothetical protein [Bauldia sp.]MCB1495911.1 hypothetical protein [Bauldia sp.]
MNTPLSRKIAVAAISLGIMAVRGGGASADEGGFCGRFTLVGGEKEVAFVDEGASGASIGDTRAGWRILNDEQGEPVGEVHFVATVTRVAASGDTVVGDYVVTLPKGWLTASTLYTRSSATDVSQRAGNARLAVTGGVGLYRDVAGEIEIEAGDQPRYLFDLDCD